MRLDELEGLMNTALLSVSLSAEAIAKLRVLDCLSKSQIIYVGLNCIIFELQVICRL